MGQGRVLGADAALSQNMVDGIATLDDVIKKMRRDARQLSKPGATRLRQARSALALL
jgi:ClpP class serine protease